VIVTDAGTFAALLLLARLTTVALVAAEVNVTVQASVPAPVSELLLQESALSVAEACPVPLRLIVDVPPLVALLLIVTVPVLAPAVVGSKLIVRVAVWPGFKVTGKLIPESAKPVPVTEALEIVTAAVPEDVSVTVFAMVVLSASVPNATLVALRPRPGVALEGVRCSVNVAEIPFEVAVSVTVCGELTADTVAVNGSLVSWVHTYMVAGTCTAGLLLVSWTARIPLVLRLMVTVQLSVPAALNVAVLHETPVS
jgi:hypothetical protein